MRALKVGDQVGLVFTTVLDHIGLGLVDEDEELHEWTDRSYWEERGSQRTVALADSILELARKLDPQLELKYNKFYIGLAKAGAPRNFVIFRPKKTFLRFEPRLPRSDATQAELEAAGLDVMDYDQRWNRYRIRLTAEGLKQHHDILEKVIGDAW